MSATGLQPETIVSRLSLKLGGRLDHCEEGFRKIGASEGRIDIIKNGYKPTWIKSVPRQRVVACNPPSLLKPPMFSILKSQDFSRKELSVR